MSQPRAYYNEIDPYAAAWLRNLIAAGHIAPGDVDERSIVDVRPSDLAGYTQCHFFAGIGVWSAALRATGWADTRRVWTGSCPCQPFSAAGKGGGFDDERHLWPAFQWLIQQCRPDVVFGEQVASKDGLAWLDLVSTDLEAMGYACGAVPFPAAGIGAPHIRQRLYWVADSERGDGRGEHRNVLGGAPGTSEGNGEERQRLWANSTYGCATGVVANAAEPGRSARRGAANEGDGGWPTRIQPRRLRDAGEYGVALGDANDSGLEGWRLSAERARELFAGQAGVAGHWSDADWLFCRDGKFRPVEPGTFPLAHGAASRVGRLRAYGNAIVKGQAEAFIGAYLDAAA